MKWIVVWKSTLSGRIIHRSFVYKETAMSLYNDAIIDGIKVILVHPLKVRT